MSIKVCTVGHCISTYYLTGRLSGLDIRWSLLMENFKLYETGSCLPHCFLSVCLYYLSPWRDSPPTTHFSQNTSFSKKCVFFFFASGDHAVWPHLKAMARQKKRLPLWQAQRPRSNISTFFSVNLRGQVDIFCYCFITPIMTHLHHIMLKHRGSPPFEQQQGRCMSFNTLHLPVDGCVLFLQQTISFVPFLIIILKLWP